MADKKNRHQSRVMQCHIEPPLCSAADAAVSDWTHSLTWKPLFQNAIRTSFLQPLNNIFLFYIKFLLHNNQEKTCWRFNEVWFWLSVLQMPFRCAQWHQLFFFTSDKRSVTKVKHYATLILNALYQAHTHFCLLYCGGCSLLEFVFGKVRRRRDSLKVYCGQLMKCRILKLQLSLQCMYCFCHGGGVCMFLSVM